MAKHGAWVVPVALQTSLFAAVGVGLYALRRFGGASLHPVLVEYPELVRRFPGLAATVSELGRLGNDAGLRALLQKVQQIVDMDLRRGPGAEWKISRLSSEVVRDADAMCVAAPKTSSDELFRAVLACRDETIPQLRGHLDDLLHNHMLARL